MDPASITGVETESIAASRDHRFVGILSHHLYMFVLTSMLSRLYGMSSIMERTFIQVFTGNMTSHQSKP
jgi:hypothetical protein